MMSDILIVQLMGISKRTNIWLKQEGVIGQMV